MSRDASLEKTQKVFVTSNEVKKENDTNLLRFYYFNQKDLIKSILNKVFESSNASETTFILNNEEFHSVGITVIKPITYDVIEKLHRELYENKFILNWMLKRSGKGIRVALY